MAVVKNTRKIYVANISRHAREKDIGHLFEECGRIASLEHKGNFGFIEYEDQSASDNAIRKFHDHDFMGKRLIVKPYRYRGGDFRYNPDAAPNPAKFRGPRSVSYRLYITGLDDSTSWQDVKDFARTGGRSVCYTDVYTRHGKKEGVIEYYRREDFEYAMRYLDRARLNGCRVRVFDRQPGGGDKGGRRSRSRSRGRGRGGGGGGGGGDYGRRVGGGRDRDRDHDRDRDRGGRGDYVRRRSRSPDRRGSPPRGGVSPRGGRSPFREDKRDIKRSKSPFRDVKRENSPAPLSPMNGGLKREDKGMDIKDERGRDRSRDRDRSRSRSKSPYGNGNGNGNVHRERRRSVSPRDNRDRKRSISRERSKSPH